MWLSQAGKTPGELPRGCRRGGELYVRLVEGQGNWGLLCLRDAVPQSSGHQHQELQHDLRCSPTFLEFGWGRRGTCVAAGVGIPDCVGKHAEMTLWDATGDTVNWGPLWISLRCSFHSLINSRGSHLTGLVLVA